MCWQGRGGSVVSAPDTMEKPMKYRVLVTGMAALAIGAPALADAPTPLHPDPGHSAAPPAAEILAQAYPAPPSYPPAPPPAYPSAVMPPAPSPSFVWEPGHWYWNGVQYQWQSGRYIAKPTTTATYTPGHWEQRPE